MSDSMRPHRRQLTSLLRPWDSPGKSTGVGCHCLLCHALTIAHLSGSYHIVYFMLFLSPKCLDTIPIPPVIQQRDYLDLNPFTLPDFPYHCFLDTLSTSTLWIPSLHTTQDSGEHHLIGSRSKWTQFCGQYICNYETCFLSGISSLTSWLSLFCLHFSFYLTCTSEVAQMVKNLPAVWETQVWSLGQEDPLEKGMGTHSSILAWRIPWTEEPGGLWSMGSQKVRVH